VNYINKLQRDRGEATERVLAMKDRIEELRAHLQSSKFGPQADGTRGDWMSTTDIQRWLRYIEDPTIHEERYGLEDK
jgi:hypothetical protein